MCLFIFCKGIHDYQRVTHIKRERTLKNVFKHYKFKDNVNYEWIWKSQLNVLPSSNSFYDIGIEYDIMDENLVYKYGGIFVNISKSIQRFPKWLRQINSSINIGSISTHLDKDKWYNIELESVSRAITIQLLDTMVYYSKLNQTHNHYPFK